MASAEALRKAGDDLYEAVMNSYWAGYLEEAREAIEAWHDLRIKESDDALTDGGCACPCHQVVQPGLVPCPRCEQDTGHG